MAIDCTELVDGDVLTLGQVGVTVQESAGGVALTENIDGLHESSPTIRLKAGVRRTIRGGAARQRVGPREPAAAAARGRDRRARPHAPDVGDPGSRSGARIRINRG